MVPSVVAGAAGMAQPVAVTLMQRTLNPKKVLTEADVFAVSTEDGVKQLFEANWTPRPISCSPYGPCGRQLRADNSKFGFVKAEEMP